MHEKHQEHASAGPIKDPRHEDCVGRDRQEEAGNRIPEDHGQGEVPGALDESEDEAGDQGTEPPLKLG